MGASDQRRNIQMQMYETIFILDSLLAPEEIDKIIDRVKEMIEANGGKCLTVDKWGKRRLAYEIQKKQYGFYVAIEFEGEGPIPNSLEREYNFNDKILRFLTYRYTKNKIIARKIEVETKKDQPVIGKDPEISPKDDLTDKSSNKTTENIKTVSEDEEIVAAEDTSLEEREVDNA
jgi:small subunit ribosomal protein S6